MRIVFFGSSDFAEPCLTKLVKSKFEIVAVITQPDRPKGRNLRCESTLIKKRALEFGIEVLQPEDCKEKEFIETLKKFDADLFVTVAYGQILSEEILNAPKLFCINLHASLLPQYRGAAPINWVILNGEKETGVTVFKINLPVDCGEIISKKSIEINDSDNSLTLYSKLSQIGAELLLESISMIDSGSYTLQEQPAGNFHFAAKLKKTDGLIDWSKDANKIVNMVRGLLPWPCAYTYFDSKMLKIYNAKVLESVVIDAKVADGTIVQILKQEGFCVRCKNLVLLIKEVQLEGSRRMNAYNFCIGHKMVVGMVLG